MDKMSAAISVNVKSNGDGTYDTYVSTENSSGEHYNSITARQIGENVADLIDCLEEANSGQSFLKKRWELIETNGYYIKRVGIYDTKELAIAAMQTRYDELNRNEEGDEWYAMSYINGTDATLYDGGEDVYLWECYEM